MIFHDLLVFSPAFSNWPVVKIPKCDSANYKILTQHHLINNFGDRNYSGDGEHSLAVWVYNLSVSFFSECFYGSWFWTHWGKSGGHTITLSQSCVTCTTVVQFALQILLYVPMSSLLACVPFRAKVPLSGRGNCPWSSPESGMKWVSGITELQTCNHREERKKWVTGCPSLPHVMCYTVRDHDGALGAHGAERQLYWPLSVFHVKHQNKVKA